MSDTKESGKSTGKRIKKAKSAKIYPPDLRVVIGGGLTKDEMVDAMVEAMSGYWKQTDELNAPKRKR